MSINNLVGNYAKFNSWANNRIITWLRGIDRSVLIKETPSSFSTVISTIQHILKAEKFWLTFISQSDEEMKNFDWSAREQDIDLLFEQVEAISRKLEEKVVSFSETELNQILSLDVPWSHNSRSRSEYIFHIINHSSYHRGQIVTMARFLGISNGIPNTDFNMFNTP